MKPQVVKILGRNRTNAGSDPGINYAQIGRKDWTKRVRNPLARECILAAYSAFERGDRELYPTVADLPPDLQALFKQLKQSDLARQVAGGMDSLPDIYAEMAEATRSLERHWTPRTYGNLTLHVLANLDWYLDRSKPPQTRARPMLYSLGWTLLWTIAGVTQILLTGQSFRDWFLSSVYVWFGLAGIISAVVAYQRRRPLLDDQASRRAMAFVLYLIDEYGEKDA